MSDNWSQMFLFCYTSGMLMDFSPEEKESLNKLMNKISNARLTRISSMNDLWSLTDEVNARVIKKIVQLDPTQFGFKGRKIPNKSVPKNIVKVDISQSAQDDSTRTYQYLPAPVYEAFMRMNQQFTKDNPGRTLLVGSGYRSTAYQITILIGLLVNTYNFDITKTLKGAALPGYSQHGSASETAIDISNINGQPSAADPEDFKDCVEYQWLTKNANNLGFYESYPPNNPDGIRYEPWHWQYRLNY